MIDRKTKVLFALTQSLNIEVFWQALHELSFSDTYDRVKALIITPVITCSADLCELYIHIFSRLPFFQQISFMFGLNWGQARFHLLNVCWFVRTNTKFVWSQRPSWTCIAKKKYIVYIFFFGCVSNSWHRCCRWLRHCSYQYCIIQSYGSLLCSVSRSQSVVGLTVEQH